MIRSISPHSIAAMHCRRLRYILQEHGMTGKELARRAGIHYSTVRFILTRRSYPLPCTYNKIASVLGLPEYIAPKKRLRSYKRVPYVRRNKVAYRNIRTLQLWRIDFGLSVNQLAQESGIHRSTLSKYEQGKCVPSPESYNMLAQVFGWQEL